MAYYSSERGGIPNLCLFFSRLSFELTLDGDLLWKEHGATAGKECIGRKYLEPLLECHFFHVVHTGSRMAMKVGFAWGRLLTFHVDQVIK